MEMNIFKTLKITGADKIARRYFIVNSFDGILTSLGIIVGIYSGGLAEPKIIIVAVLGAAIALAVSGISSGYISEEAEHKNSMKRIERAMLTKLSKTKMGGTARKSTLFVALVNGLSPALACVIIIMPSFLALWGIIPKNSLLPSMLIISFILLISLGIVLGKTAKENVWKYALKALVIGVIAAALTSMIALF
jgi:predicted membrane protein (TIGR00267 family)